MLTRFLSLLLILCLLPWAFAAAEWEDDEYEDDAWADVYDEESEFSLAWLRPLKSDAAPVQVTWRTLGMRKAEKLPVYSAPFADAWRGAKGKAAVSTAEPFTLLGAAQEGKWLLVEYTVSAGERRIGWIETPDTGRLRDLLGRDPWCIGHRLLCRVTAKAALTDDPRGGRRVLRDLAPGESVIAMGRLNEDGAVWVLVETEIDGKTAWGFIPRDALEAVPTVRVEGTALVVSEGVTLIGDSSEWLGDDAQAGDYDFLQISIAPGDVWISGINVSETYGLGIRDLRLPSTLRVFGEEALVFAHLESLTLRGGTRSARWPFYSVTVDRLVLAADYDGEIPGGEYFYVGAYEAEPGNPRYLTKDGVLFSADGKTLLAYPSDSPRTHYDVPAGTEVIGRSAFSHDWEGVALTSLSLPVGLKRIEAYAFTGCTRIVSLTVPLTVTELDPTAFNSCVSLERLSLPPGMTADIGHWAEQGDFTYYNGDNGSTAPDKTRRLPEDEDRTSIDARIAAPDAGDAPCYAAPDSEAPSGTLPTGLTGWITGMENGRVRFERYNGALREREEYWVDGACVRRIIGDPFFTVSDAVPTEAGRAEMARQIAADESGISAAPDDFLFGGESYDGSGLDFYGPGMAWVGLGWDQADLCRAPDGTGRTLGILLPDTAALYDPEAYRPDGIPVFLYDAPDGAPAIFLFAWEQAEVTDRADGWLRVRHPQGEGWIRESGFREVREKGE